MKFQIIKINLIFFWNEIYNSTYNFDFEIKEEKDFDELKIIKVIHGI